MVCSLKFKNKPLGEQEERPEIINFSVGWIKEQSDKYNKINILVPLRLNQSAPKRKK